MSYFYRLRTFCYYTVAAVAGLALSLYRIAFLAQAYESESNRPKGLDMLHAQMFRQELESCRPSISKIDHEVHQFQLGLNLIIERQDYDGAIKVWGDQLKSISQCKTKIVLNNNLAYAYAKRAEQKRKSDPKAAQSIKSASDAFDRSKGIFSDDCKKDVEITLAVNYSILIGQNDRRN